MNMTNEEAYERVCKDKNVLRAYQVGKNLIQKARGLENPPPLLEHSIFLTKLLLMKSCKLTIEQVDDLLAPEDKNVIKIGEDVNEAFINLRKEYDNSKQMSVALGISEGTVSMYVNRKRNLTVDKMIEYLKRIKRKYTVEV